MFDYKIAKTQIIPFFLATAFAATVIQCKKENAVSDIITKTVTPTADSAKSVQKDSIKQEIPQKTTATYTAFIFPEKKKDSAAAAFKEKFSEEERYAILALNRLDSKNKWRADTLAIPDKIDTTLMAYTPFPTYMEKLKDVKKIAFFSYPIQAYSLYENGKLVKWGPSSMGKKAAQTKRGLMFANWKKELAISTVDSEWKLPYNVNVHNTLGIGWHQYDLPGYPASHSCLRLLMNDAKFMYSWADTWVLNKGGATVKANGTPVIVFGDYKWGGKKPWKNLVTDPHANDISVEELDAVVEPNLAKIMEEQANREKVVAEIAAQKAEEVPAA